MYEACMRAGEWICSLSPEAIGWVAMGIVLTIGIGWNAFAGWINGFEVEIYDAEWMDYSAWEATRDVS